MSCRKKVSDELLIKEYERLGNVWKVADAVGLCGQTVHGRLSKIGKINKMRILTEDEKRKIEQVYNSGIERGDGKLQKLSKEIGRTIPFISRYAGKKGLTTYSRKVKNKAHSNDIDPTHPLAPIYYMMINRCHNTENKSYSRYGERGIYVCKRWRNSFKSFLKDMGERPSKKHSIDRIDNKGPYSPENCRWATTQQQANNTRKNRIICVDGQEMTLAQASRKYGINVGTLYSRLKKGISPDSACKDPVLTQGTGLER